MIIYLKYYLACIYIYSHTKINDRMYIYDMNINLIINHYINPYTLFRGVQYDF